MEEKRGKEGLSISHCRALRMARTTDPGEAAAGTAPDRRIGAPDPGSARGEAPAALCPPQPTSPRRAAGPPREAARP